MMGLRRHDPAMSILCSWRKQKMQEEETRKRLLCPCPLSLAIKPSLTPSERGSRTLIIEESYLHTGEKKDILIYKNTDAGKM